jgi:hypothetical protein
MNGNPISVRDFILKKTYREGQIRRYRVYGMFLYKYLESIISDVDILTCPICKLRHPTHRSLLMHLTGNTRCASELTRIIDRALYIWSRFKKVCRKLYRKNKNKLYTLLIKYQPHEVYIMCEKDEYPE